MIAKKNRPKGRLSVARFIYNKSKSKIKIKAPAIENKSAIIKPPLDALKKLHQLKNHPAPYRLIAHKRRRLALLLNPKPRSRFRLQSLL